jgi:hypothetical protein
VTRPALALTFPRARFGSIGKGMTTMASRPRWCACPLHSRSARRLTAFVLTVAQIAIGGGMPVAARRGDVGAPFAVPASDPQQATAVSVNRTVPRVDPPSTAIRFSAQPTEEEVFRARVFTEPLVPVGPPGADDTRALAEAISRYRAGNDVDALGVFEAFLARFPGSAWRSSLEVNLARVYVRRGEFSRALGLWDAAWRRTRDDVTPHGRAVADDAMGAGLEFLARLGRAEAIEERLRDAGPREFHGPAASRVEEARAVASVLTTRPDDFLSCGRQALALLWPLVRGTASLPAELARPGTDDESLADLQTLAGRLGLRVQMVRRSSAEAEPVFPAILHLNLGHWTVLVRSDGERYLLRDPSLGGEIWVTRAALAAEWSGYALVPRDARPDAWSVVTAAAARAVTGRSVCPPGGASESEPPCPDPPCCPESGGPGPDPISWTDCSSWSAFRPSSFGALRR